MLPVKVQQIEATYKVELGSTPCCGRITRGLHMVERIPQTDEARAYHRALRELELGICPECGAALARSGVADAIGYQEAIYSEDKVECPAAWDSEKAQKLFLALQEAKQSTTVSWPDVS